LDPNALRLQLVPRALDLHLESCDGEKSKKHGLKNNDLMWI
jgi:hypothetical protein